MRDRPPRYRVIYNWDGAPHGYDPVPQSMPAFLEHVYAPCAADTQVDALFWCVGEHAARWPSQRLEQLGDTHGRRYERAASYTHTENIRRMLERGEDPQAALIEEGHRRGLQVWASVRMNDNHFDGAQVADLAQLHHTELTQLRRAHPEWLLGARTSEWFALSWDLSVPAVRQHRLDHIREVCEHYDWDGVELDWQRHAFHLPADDAYRLRYALTDLQRAARQLADEVGRRRGRPLHVAVRVAGDPAVGAQLGYDIDAWIAEDLTDIVIAGGGAATDPDLDIAGYVARARPHGIAVYGGFDGALPEAPCGPEPADRKNRLRTRAIAAEHWRAGADGIYCFNWHAGADTRRDLLTCVGDAATLAGRDKLHAATHRVLVDEGPWRGAYRIDRTRGTVPVALCATLTGCGPVIPLTVTDDLTARPAAAVELRVRLQDAVDGDRVAVRWDGQALVHGRVDVDRQPIPLDIGAVSDALWLRFALSADRLSQGTHTVEVVLEERHPQLDCDLVLTDVELAVAYDPAWAASLLPLVDEAD